MINVENMSYGFPQKVLYDQVSFTLELGDHCAFIGANGTGKSTLIDIIRNPEEIMYQGKVEIEAKGKIGYVSQFGQMNQDRDMSVFAYVADDFLRLEKEIEELCVEMGQTQDIDQVMVRYQDALDRYEAIGGDNYESAIKSRLNLAGLGEFFDQSIKKLSGGEFKLVEIIKEMLTSPELLIMDEPDVFLDFENLNGLRKLFNEHKGTLLVITHNRYLLDYCFDKILHLENKKIRAFEGNFREYNFSLLQEKIEQQELAIADQEEIKRNDVLIERLRDISSVNAEKANGKTLKARVKIQERLIERQVPAPYVDIHQPEIELGMKEREMSNIDQSSSDEEAYILKVSDYQLAFDQDLLENVNFEIGPKDKVALIGDNGSGKTSLMRDILKGTKDSIIYAQDVLTSYLSQDQSEVLHEDKTILEEFMDLGFETYQEAEAYLADYGFEKDNLSQMIGAMSGGEKNILQLAKLSTMEGNLLLLDEPTSHLDTYAQMALEEAISKYPGAVLMISHDYYSIINCMDYVLKIENKTIRKIKMKKFKRMVYANYFDRDYLALEEKKKSLETQIAMALKSREFEKAGQLAETLETIIDQMR